MNDQRRTRARSRRRSLNGRSAEVRRRTKETEISLRLSLDGDGQAQVHTGIGFLDHMLETLARHGFLNLEIAAQGDLHVDQHHTVEDVGLALGQAFRQALGDKRGIRRFGFACCPLDEALVQAAVDLSGRPYLQYGLQIRASRVGNFDTELVHDFMLAFVNEAGMNLHLLQTSGRNAHHIIEAAFKALARALDEAKQLDPRVRGVPSTKGSL